MDPDNSKVLELTESNFDEKIASTNKPILVDFWAPWCGPCRFLSPVIEEIAEENTGAEIYKVNVDENPKISAQFGIMSIPTVMIFKEGNTKEVFVGVQSKETYKDAIAKHI